MSWDENLFKVAFDRYQRFKNRELINNRTYNIELTSLMSRLTIMASALAETPIEIFPIRSGFGETRTKNIILPVEINFFKDALLNELLYVSRTGFSSLVIREYHQQKIAGSFNENNWVELTNAVINHGFPGLANTLQELDQEAEKIGKLESWILISRGTFPYITFDTNTEDEESIILDSVSSRKKEDQLENKRPSLAKRRTLDTKDPNPAVHVFEKVLTAEDYQGGKRNIDSDEDSSDMSAALSELNMDQVVRASGETGSTYSGGLFLDEEHSIKKEGIQIKNEQNLFHYPEWSRRKLQFIPNWCTVYEEKKHRDKSKILTTTPLMKSEVKRLKRKLEILVNKPIWSRNQQDGTELDMEALVRFKSDLKAGSTPTHNLYIERHKLEQDIALLVLADTSLSTDAWIANKRVFETIQQSLLILAETLQDFSHTVSMAAFFSNTRNHCTYLRIKDFQEKWDFTSSQIEAMKPQGYTRMGPAIRHATHVLENVKARKKILLVISDSKPTDYDAYEGVHGESDVHHSILEARTKNITVKGLAVAAPKSGHVKRIYGRNGFESFTDARGLSERIIRAYSEAIK